MKHSDSLGHIAKAMSGLQSEIRDAEKDTQGYGYKYADLYQVLSLIRPLLLKHGLSFSQHVENADDKILICTIVMHESGEWMSSQLSMPPVQSKSMNAAQAVGNIITYGRRYSLTSVFGITQTADIDNDARHADQTTDSKPAAKPPEAQQVKIDVSAKLNALASAWANEDKLAGDSVLKGLSADEKKAIWPLLTGPQKEWVKSISYKPVPGEQYAGV